MAKFYIEDKDYSRYGLDDSRCSRQRPTGVVQLSIESSEWHIKTESRKWIFNRQIKWTFSKPLCVRQLYDCFSVEFSYPNSTRAGLLLLVPFSALSNAEKKAFEELSEKRHPKNASGDFYGTSSECCCIEACAPSEIAPQLIGYQQEPEGCYFIKQPQTEAEYELAIQATLSAFVDSLRYGGNNPKTLKRIREATRNPKLNFCQGDLCDYPTE